MPFALALAIVSLRTSYASTGEGEFWQLISSANVARELPYSKTKGFGHANPSCMQGLYYMDQQCTTSAQLPSDYSCGVFGGFNYVAQIEYLTAFGEWNSDTHCVTLLRSAWTFGAADRACTICHGEAPTFCQTNSADFGPCDVGAYFRGPFIFDMVMTSFGWDRKSTVFGIGGHYPVLKVVDGHGRKTKWFDSYMEEATRTQCPPGQDQCRLNEWAASAQTANCLHSSVGAEACAIPTWQYFLVTVLLICLCLCTACCFYKFCKGGAVSSSRRIPLKYEDAPLE